LVGLGIAPEIEWRDIGLVNFRKSGQAMNFALRQAVATDIPALRALIDASVLGLQAADYTPAQIEGALQTVYGVDSQLIADGTYLVAEMEDAGPAKPTIVA